MTFPTPTFMKIAAKTDAWQACSFFEGEPVGDNHYLGCLPEINPDMPYWAGYCDLQDGFDCATAEDLFNAPYYSKKSLVERWHEIHIYEIGSIPIEQFIEWHNDKFPIISYSETPTGIPQPSCTCIASPAKEQVCSCPDLV